jgi:hypothetical protein
MEEGVVKWGREGWYGRRRGGMEEGVVTWGREGWYGGRRGGMEEGGVTGLRVGIRTHCLPWKVKKNLEIVSRGYTIEITLCFSRSHRVVYTSSYVTR